MAERKRAVMLSEAVAREERLPTPKAQDAKHAAPTEWEKAQPAAGPPCAGWWASEPSVGRVAHGVPNRVGRLAALGNALVPQIAEWIGRPILDFERAAGRELS